MEFVNKFRCKLTFRSDSTRETLKVYCVFKVCNQTLERSKYVVYRTKTFLFISGNFAGLGTIFVP